MVYAGKYLKNQNGTAAVEFALLAPVLILIIIGIYDYGMYMNHAIKVESTSRAAAEYVVLGGDEDTVDENVLDQSGLDGAATLIITHSYECADGAAAAADTDCGEGDYLRHFVHVALSMPYEPVFLFPGLSHLTTLRGEVRVQASS